MFHPVFTLPHQQNGPVGPSGVSVRLLVVVVYQFDLDHAKDMASVPVWLAIVASKSLNRGAILISANPGPSGASMDPARLLVEWVSIHELDRAFHTARIE